MSEPTTSRVRPQSRPQMRSQTRPAMLSSLVRRKVRKYTPRMSNAYITYNYTRNAEDGTYSCAECRYVATSLGRMNAHMVKHSPFRPFVCPFESCGRQPFNRKASLKRHIRGTHYDLRPHRCHVCGKCFRQSQTLTDHSYQHLNGKLFACDVGTCRKSFQAPKNLAAHKRRRHRVFSRGTAADTHSNGQQSNGQQSDEGHESHESHVTKEKKSVDTKAAVKLNDKRERWKPFKCYVIDCEQRFFKLTSLRAHIMDHKHKNEYNVCTYGAVSRERPKKRLFSHVSQVENEENKIDFLGYLSLKKNAN